MPPVQKQVATAFGAILRLWVNPSPGYWRLVRSKSSTCADGHTRLAHLGQARGLRRADLDALLEQVGLGGRGGDLLAAHSSRMGQQLRYTYTLLHQPPALLLNEPNVTLDERDAEVVERIVQAQRERGILVIATNDPRELRYGDYVLRLGGL